ncbi:MAG: hypothetical protein E6600_12110 [Anaerocolumna aminovalerica]|jgi:translation elongation factor EF-Tu-like GTPase|uniref:hypothetical protein n=1 Tax=Anaerocolumna aminovalerica TaxID=1527 RepID=UPI001C0EDEB3|nr:hypothetical protein [Anaerocolumna aminovalerica]MBU5333780.1 hypothetical protein [Anaerocolumna aminovalerica]MDU6265233.1 hypothetical protein [Anaerocolumna aminovalerica]
MGIFNIFSKKEDISELGKYAFEMQIDDIFSLIPTGVVLVGIIRKGKIHTNSDIMIIDKNGEILHKKIVSAMEQFYKPVSLAKKGQAVAIKLDNITKEEINIGNYIVIE